MPATTSSAADPARVERLQTRSDFTPTRAVWKGMEMVDSVRAAPGSPCRTGDHCNVEFASRSDAPSAIGRFYVTKANALNLPPPDFLSPGAMIFSLANIVTWEYVGYNMVIYYAALKAIPSDLAEASRMDGASPWQFARLIQLPLLWPAILLTIIFSINGTLQLFNEPYLMRALASNTINSSYTPNLYAYSLATKNQQYGYAAAVSFVLGILIAGAAYIFTLITNRRRPGQ